MRTVVLYLIILTLLFFASCSSKHSETKFLVIQTQNSVVTSQQPLNIWTEKEKEYKDLLAPIFDLKTEDSTIYYFIVSWLGTQYNTPDWNGYYSESWKEKTMKRGIDCSGFARVIQDRIFNKKIKGGSRGILQTYCKIIQKEELQQGDLVFFQAPNSNKKRIVHVGTYLQDGHFVHATSRRSAKKGRGLDINHINQPRWKKTLVYCGRVK